MTEGGGDSSTAMVDVLDLAKNAISISGLKDAQVCHVLCILTVIQLILDPYSSFFCQFPVHLVQKLELRAV